MKPEYQIGSALDVGIKRRENPNQDAIGLALPNLLFRNPPLFVLSDGMGGYNGGEIASRLAVNAIIKSYRRSRIKNEGYLPVLESGIGIAHKLITRKSKSKKELEAMGCTIVAAILTESQIHIANVGDSRAYLISPTEITQISYDHSRVAEFVRAGLITELEALNHPKRNELTLSLTGRRSEAPPFLASVNWEIEDALLLCSDGLWGPVTESQIHAVVTEMEPQAAADKLVALANTNRGPDNISVIIARHEGVKLPLKEENEDITNPGG